MRPPLPLLVLLLATAHQVGAQELPFPRRGAEVRVSFSGAGVPALVGEVHSADSVSLELQLQDESRSSAPWSLVRDVQVRSRRGSAANVLSGAVLGGIAGFLVSHVLAGVPVGFESLYAVAFGVPPGIVVGGVAGFLTGKGTWRSMGAGPFQTVPRENAYPDPPVGAANHPDGKGRSQSGEAP